MELWEIINKGDADKLNALIASGLDINQGDEDGSTLLHHGARMGRLEMVRVLLDAGANVNACDTDGVTPLLEAVQEQHADSVQLLLERGADPNLGRDLNGRALHYAASNGDPEIGRLLLGHGAEIDALDNEADCWTPLHYAAFHNRLEFARLLAESGADLFGSSGEGWPLDTALSHGRREVAGYLYGIVENAHPGSLGTLLHAAAGLRDANLMAQLTGGNDQVDIRDYAARTPLHWAAGQDRTLFFQIILEHAAKQNAYPLPAEFHRGDVGQAIEFLLEKGADIEAKDYDGNTPLLLALQWGQADAAACLLNHQVDVTVADGTGWTPAILAASGGHLGILKTLVERGADLHAIRNEWNALNYACHHGKEAEARFLLDCGMDVNGAGQRTRLSYPLFSAIFMGEIPIIKLLLERGADTRLKDEEGNTAFSLAQGKTHLLKLLNEYGASR